MPTKNCLCPESLYNITVGDTGGLGIDRCSPVAIKPMGISSHGTSGRLQEKAVVTSAELLSTLRRYLEESGDSEQKIASHLGINHQALLRWLSDEQAPEKEKVARIALFLRRANYL